MNINEKKALIKINSAYILKTDWIINLLNSFKPEEILKMTPADISFEGNISIEKAHKFIEIISKFDPDKEILEAEKSKIKIICYGENEYPEEFKVLQEPPIAFYIKGSFNNKLSLSVVGTRKPTEYGKKMTIDICSKISRAGINIVSGLARGIDTIAHRTAIKYGGFTYAITGSGLDNIYPPENKKLFEDISENGAVISEYPFGTKPLPYNFPRRNRLISALSWGTFVVEGDYNSGAIITAKYAIEQNKEVMALPGPIDSLMSNGPNKLIKEGAFLIQSAKDIIATIPSSMLYGINLNAINEKEQKQKFPEGLSKTAIDVYNLIKSFPQITPDEISHKLSIDISTTSNLLLELELNNLILNIGGKYSINLL